MNPARRVFTPSVFGIIVLALITLNSSNALAQRLWLHDEGSGGDPTSHGTPCGADTANVTPCDDDAEAAIKARITMRLNATHDYRNGYSSAHMTFDREDNPPHANKEQPLRYLGLDGQSPLPNAPTVEYKSTPKGSVVTVVYADAAEFFYNHNGYHWIGIATITLTDGDPANQPDTYQVKFEPTHKNRETDLEHAETFPPPTPVSGIVFEGIIKESDGDIIVTVECAESDLICPSKPVALIQWPEHIVPVGVPVGSAFSLTGEESYDPDNGPGPLPGNGIVKYEWAVDANIDSGNYQDLGSPFWTGSFATPGTHRVGLRITDDEGIIATDEERVEIVASDIRVSTNLLDFKGDIASYSSKKIRTTLGLDITNVGSGDLNGSFTDPATPFVIVDVKGGSGARNFSLRKGETATITLRFEPNPDQLISDPTNFNSLITITSNDKDVSERLINVLLKGEGIGPQPIQFSKKRLPAAIERHVERTRIPPLHPASIVFDLTWKSSSGYLEDLKNVEVWEWLSPIAGIASGPGCPPSHVLIVEPFGFCLKSPGIGPWYALGNARRVVFGWALPTDPNTARELDLQGTYSSHTRYIQSFFVINQQYRWKAPWRRDALGQEIWTTLSMHDIKRSIDPIILPPDPLNPANWQYTIETDGETDSASPPP